MKPLSLARAAVLALAACAGPGGAMHLTDVKGQLHTLDGYRGKWVVLNVWATWCAPCIREMPELEALSRARPDVVVLGLAADGEDVEKIVQYAVALRVTYPVIAGNAAMMQEYKVRAYPTTLLFDATGQLVLTRMGQISRQDLLQHLPARAAADP